MTDRGVAARGTFAPRLRAYPQNLIRFIPAKGGPP